MRKASVSAPRKKSENQEQQDRFQKPNMKPTHARRHSQQLAECKTCIRKGNRLLPAAGGGGNDVRFPPQRSELMTWPCSKQCLQNLTIGELTVLRITLADDTARTDQNVATVNFDRGDEKGKPTETRRGREERWPGAQRG